MNQDNIMNKIPEDVVGHIMSFIFDRRDYHYIDIQRRIRKMNFKMKRVFAELMLFSEKYKCNMKVLKYRMPNYSRKYKEFLNKLKDGKPIVTYHTGLYEKLSWEYSWIEKLWQGEERVNNHMINRYLKYTKINGKRDWYEKWVVRYQNNIWQDTYRRIVNKSNSEDEKWQSSRRMLDKNIVESSKKWNRIMAGAANTPL